MEKLNIGCGEKKREGYLNVDWNPVLNPEVIHDLNVFPYPFADNTFDLVEASHILEHLDKPFAVLREIHRLLKPGGKLILKVPHFSRGFTHPEHCHGFDVTLPKFLDKSFVKSAYCGADFELEKITMRWFPFTHCLPYLGYGKIFSLLINLADKIISFFANLSPYFCSRIWCFWVGGFDEMEFIFINKK